MLKDIIPIIDEVKDYLAPFFTVEGHSSWTDGDEKGISVSFIGKFPNHRQAYEYALFYALHYSHLKYDRIIIIESLQSRTVRKSYEAMEVQHREDKEKGYL